MAYNRAFALQHRGLIGGVVSGVDGILGGNNGASTSSTSDPLGLGGLTSALSPLFPTGAQSTSTSSTILLTDSSSSSATPTSASSSSTSSSTTLQSTVSTTSATTSSTSTSSSASSSAARSTSTNSNSSTSAPTLTNTLSPTLSAHSSSTTHSSSSSSPSPSTSSATLPASSPQGFLQNKALSVGVITASSLVALILIVVLATWAIRRRSRNKLHDEAVDWTPFPSSDELPGRADVEQGGNDGTGLPGEGRRGSRGSGLTSGSQTIAPAESSSAQKNAHAQGPDMYERTGYPALPVFVPAPTTPQATYANQPYSNPVQNVADLGPYPSFDPRAGPSAYNPKAPLLLPANNVDSRYSRSYASRQSQRKQQQALLPLNIGASRSVDASPPAYPGGSGAVPSPISAVSLTAGPVQPAGTVNPANPRESPTDQMLIVPGSRSKHSSLLDSPAQLAYTINEPAERERPLSHTRQLGSTPAQLPDEFGSVAAVSGDEKAALRRLTVSTLVVPT
ncbi:uncharacterized protein FIBRA_07052 [Fibroporia radiculosa]|uniref:Uncharacterized protein n=1 Tax=Fibroporia radiculosa TaxID=599839 RepID=J4H4E6_9APHY|nr:uncharacterized protein FIBRA_07052 [Fibroporia radiculosa]CCM04859.1 predicted protein [Fibroporia radiculosa]